MSGLETCPSRHSKLHNHYFLQVRVSSVAALILSAFTIVPSVASAQQWLLTPVVEIAIQNIDNPRLNEGDVDTDNITGGFLDVAAEMRRNTEISSVLFRPSAAIYRYSGDSDEDSEAFFLDFNADRTGQRSEWRFAANFSRQQVFRGETTSSEFDEPGLDDSDQTGTGRTFERRERDLWRIRPGVTFDLTERTALRFDLNYLDGRYDSQEQGEAVDYTNSQITAAIVRALTPDSNLAFGAFASQYDPTNANQETDSVGVRMRYQQNVSDISTFFIDIGAQESDLPSTVTPGEEISESAFLWNIGYNRRLERTRWQFNIGQTVTPSGSGFLVERDLYRVMMQHQLRPRWSLMLSAVAQNTSALADEGVTTTVDRDYVQGRAVLGYEMTPKWTIEGGYTLTHQDFADIPGDAQEHEFRLSFVYRPPIPTL